MEKSFKNKYIKVDFFKLPIYDSRICFVKHDGKRGYDQLVEFFKKLEVSNPEEYKDISWRNCYGFVLQERVKTGMLNIIVMNGRRDYKPEYINTLSHEVTHLIDNLCKHHGLQRYKSGDNEHIAYLTGYLTDYLYKL